MRLTLGSTLIILPRKPNSNKGIRVNIFYNKYQKSEVTNKKSLKRALPTPYHCRNGY